MDFYDILLAKKLSGGGGGGSTNDMQSYFDKTITNLDIKNSTQTDLVNYLFSGYTSLESVKISGVTTVQSYAFSDCKVKLIVLPDLTSCTSYSFALQNGSANKCTIVLPSLSNIGSDSCRGTSTYIEAIDIGSSLTSIGARTFYQGFYYNVILRSSSVVTLSSTNSVGVGANHGFSEETKVYVPSSLISQYEASTNWASAKTSKGFAFASIEGSPYEHYYADGTPIS